MENETQGHRNLKFPFRGPRKPQSVLQNLFLTMIWLTISTLQRSINWYLTNEIIFKYLKNYKRKFFLLGAYLEGYKLILNIIKLL